MSFDLVSYAAGLTSMTFVSFFIATGIGQLPATIVYSYVGGMLTGGAQLLVTGLLILFALTIFVVLIRNIYNSREANKVKEEGNEKYRKALIFILIIIIGVILNRKLQWSPPI